MGIKGLVGFLQEHAPEAIKDISPGDLKHKIIGVDAPIMLNKGAAMAQSEGKFFYLEMLAKHFTFLQSLGCRVYYVFDGKAPVEKAPEQAKRRAIKEKNTASLQSAAARLEEDPDDLAAFQDLLKLQKYDFCVDAKMRDRARRLLVALGAEVIEAPSEAERALAHMQRAGTIDHVFTEDVDVLVCGASSYVKYFGSLQSETEGFEVKHPPKLVCLAESLAGLGLTYEEFVTFSMLSGCDFVPKLPRIGPVSAYKTVKKAGASLDACFQACAGDKDLLEQYKRARPLLTFDALDRGPICSRSGRQEQPLGGREAIKALLGELEQEGPVDRLRQRLAALQEEECPAEKRRRCASVSGEQQVAPLQ